MTVQRRETARTWQQRYVSRWYSKSPGWRDGTTIFHEMCAAMVPPTPNLRLLEIGAGPANATSDFLSTLGHLTGVDVDSVVLSNGALGDAKVVHGEELPFGENQFDACFSNWVLEHIPRPPVHMSEVMRVLKPGGYYVARTPNRFHYVSLVAAITPHRFHEMLANRLRALPDETHKPWPTFYRVNSRRALRNASQLSGLELIDIEAIESEPSYGMASRLLFIPFMLYERLVNASPVLEPLRHTFVVVLRKPESVPLKRS